MVIISVTIYHYYYGYYLFIVIITIIITIIIIIIIIAFIMVFIIAYLLAVPSWQHTPISLNIISNSSSSSFNPET